MGGGSSTDRNYLVKNLGSYLITNVAGWCEAWCLSTSKQFSCDLSYVTPFTQEHINPVLIYLDYFVEH